MGEALAILSMTMFALTNIAILRGHDGKSRSSGAFLSMIITFLMSTLIWLIMVLRNGWPELNATAVAWFALGGFLTIYVGRVLLYASIQHLGAIKASAVKRLNPFFSVLLAVLILGERISLPMMIGMLLIVMSFTVLVRQALFVSDQAGLATEKQNAFDRLLNLGYLFGPVSAFAYAAGYIARKQGMIVLPDSALGTMIGAFTGIVFFLITSRFVNSYREDVRKTFTVFNKWFLMAGCLSTFGQIAYFTALNFIGITKIALITSMEVFMTMILSAVVFQSREKLSADIIIAAGLGFLGTVFVIAF
jgi:drug/metabolite transporter (DMT)-like permease